MLRRIAQSSVQLAPRMEATVVSQRFMSLKGMKGKSDGFMGLGCIFLAKTIDAGFAAGYDERESAQEATFFHKEDEKLLRKLLQKVRAQANETDVHAAKGAEAKELSELEAIVGNKLSDEQKQGK